MDHQTEEKYSFCPQCGSLMENGVCLECTAQREQGVYSSQHYPQDQQSGYGSGGQPQEQPGPPPQEPYYGQPQSGQEPYYSQGQNQQEPYYGQPQSGQGPYYGQPQNQQGAYYGQAQNQQPYYGQGQNQQSGFYQSGQNQQNWQYQQYLQYWQSQQNPYYGQPGYQGQNQGYYQPGRKNGKNNKVWITIGIVVAILYFVFSIGISFVYGKLFMEFAESESDDFMAQEDPFDHESGGGFHQENNDDAEEDESDWSEDEAYVPSPDDTYYYGPCNAVNEDVGYSFVTKSYSNEDPDNDIDIVINYVELEGDIPNIDKLNEALEKVALYYAEDFAKDSYYAEFGDSYAVYITSYVTYNDDDIVSIVMDEYVNVDDQYLVDLYPINIDVKNGVILDNVGLIQIDEAFAGEFRRRNEEQNGTVEYLDELTDEELAAYLQDGSSMIAYYTPLGMEIGLNYETAGTTGWVTVTYKDYEQYLSKF